MIRRIIEKLMKINVMDVDCVQMHVTKMRSG